LVYELGDGILKELNTDFENIKKYEKIYSLRDDTIEDIAKEDIDNTDSDDSELILNNH
jgi:hypothetical protein